MVPEVHPLEGRQLTIDNKQVHHPGSTEPLTNSNLADITDSIKTVWRVSYPFTL